VQELFGSVTPETSLLPVDNVSVAEITPPTPPAGLIAAFNLQAAEAVASSTTPAAQQNTAPTQESFVTSFTAEVSAEATLPAAKPADEVTETSSLAFATDKTSPVTELIVEQSRSANVDAEMVLIQPTGNPVSAALDTDSPVEAAYLSNPTATLPPVAPALQQRAAQQTSANGSKSSNTVFVPADISSDLTADAAQNSGDVNRNGAANTSSRPFVPTDFVVAEVPSTPAPQMQEESAANVPDRSNTDGIVPPSTTTPKTHYAAPSTHASTAGHLTVEQAQQLVDRVSNALNQSAQSGQSLKLRLSPPELGVLQIEVSQRDGVLSARLETQTMSAHQAIVENLSSLRDALAQHGTVVERIEVHVAHNRGSDGSQDQPDRRQQDSQNQNQERQQRRDGSQQQKNQQHSPHLKAAKQSMDELDIQV
jgi:flagellar hook-length control protein FliK